MQAPVGAALHLRTHVVEKCVEIAELTVGFGEGVGDSGEAGEFGVDELVDCGDGGAFVDFLGGFLAGHEIVDRGAEFGCEVGGVERVDEGHRRRAGGWVAFDPAAAEERAGDVEVFLEFHLRRAAVAHVFAVVVLRHGEVVVHGRLGGEEGRDQLAHAFPDGRFFVDDAGLHPLEADGVGFADEAEEFPEIPAREIEQRIGRGDVAIFDDVAAWIYGEVVFERGKIDEAHVVIAVGGFKTPRTAAALDGEPDFHRPVLFDLSEGGLDVRNNRDHGARGEKDWSANGNMIKSVLWPTLIPRG